MFKRAIKSGFIARFPQSGLAKYEEAQAIAFSLQARHIEPSYIVSPDDDLGKPSDRLLDISVEAIKTCRTLKIDIFDGRFSLHPRWYEVWPGEHYRLLAALVKNLN